IVDLYSAGNVEEDGDKPYPGQCRPFLQHISFAGPQGEVVRVKALFDDGAMVGAMCSSFFHKVKHRLGNWGLSTRRLRMANGSIVHSEALWEGEITVGNIRTHGAFEVFNSGGSWKFLFGKPLLQAFNAVHDYTPDTVRI
ncbi:hypothetical protein HYDPIDRAFT_61227, partial [Hydnomerulius pinastri MD-312]